MPKVGNVIKFIAITGGLVLSVTTLTRAGESPTYLNVNPSPTTATSPSPPAGTSPGLTNRGSGNNGNGSSFCQQPIYDNWGNVTGYRQGGC
jgi:hypothetical protein